jgi:AraC-like DNA-binding protein
MTDHTERLRQAAKDRHETTLAKATTALRSLAHAAEPITFGRLARTAGVSRSWLYRQPELRQQIEQLRQSRPPKGSTVPAAQRASDDSNRQRLAIYREELERLRAENRDLREQLSRKLGAARAAAVIDLP